jgi:hypothetical protein
MRPMTCDVHFKEEGVFVISSTIDEKNPIISSVREPVITLDREPTSAALGRAVRRALDTSGTKAPEGCGHGFVAALRAAGLRGWSGLERSSRTLRVVDDSTCVKIHSDAYLCSHDSGFAGVACGRDPEEIGRRLLELRPTCPLSDPLSPARPGRSHRAQHPRPAIEGGSPATFGYKIL